MRTLLLNSEYDLLYTEGEDSLVAFFATLRANKPDTILITTQCKKGITRTISDLTGLSRNTVLKYLPEIERLGLMEWHKRGVLIRGRKWSHNNLPRQKNKKLIPITICEKFTDTKTSSFYVRVHSNLKSQERTALKKAERIKIFEQHERGDTKTLKDLKRVKRMIKKGVSLASMKSRYRSISTLSNAGFDRIKKDVGDYSKSRGNYHKSKLLKRKLIEQTRNAHLFLEGVFSWSLLYQLRDSFDNGGFFIGNKGIYYEESPYIVLGGGR